jgi:L-2-hydroxyglutarate oxidase LhgO
MTDSIDCAVIGAGVIGLAVARALALRGREVIVIEANEAIGQGISSRSSEVIHAGIYYETGSLKARLCVQGRDLLYDYCAGHGIGHRRCGKLIVATGEAEIATLKTLIGQAQANGVGDLEFLDGPEAESLEPGLKAAAAVLSPSTGIFDTHAFMLALQGDAEAAGAAVAFHSPLRGGQVGTKHKVINVGGAEPLDLTCRTLVNAAGLGAQGVAAVLDGLPRETIPRRRLAKGSYFTLGGACPFSRLLYPLPEAAGDGIHLTMDLDGQARFGPNAEWIDDIDYDVDEGLAGVYYKAIRRYWPALEDGTLSPGYAGIRPKVQVPGEPRADFIIQGADAHGIDGLVNLYGIESPGLTSSLAIAEYVADRL